MILLFCAIIILYIRSNSTEPFLWTDQQLNTVTHWTLRAMVTTNYTHSAIVYAMGHLVCEVPQLCALIFISNGILQWTMRRFNLRRILMLHWNKSINIIIIRWSWFMFKLEWMVKVCSPELMICSINHDEYIQRRVNGLQIFYLALAGQLTIKIIIMGGFITPF